MNSSPINPAGQQISMELLKMSMDKGQEMAEKLIKVNVENTINMNQLETAGNVIDMYV